MVPCVGHGGREGEREGGGGQDGHRREIEHSSKALELVDH